MLISIDDDMMVTWHLCGSLCGIVVKLILGKMLINIKSRLKLRFQKFFAMLNNPPQKRGHNSMLLSTKVQENGRGARSHLLPTLPPT
jgi:hypothetical protein